MRITIFAPFFVPTDTKKKNGFLGGSPEQAYRISSSLKKDGNDVAVICLRIGNSQEFETYKGVRILRIGNVRNRVLLDKDIFKNAVISTNPDKFLFFYVRSGDSDGLLEVLDDIEREASCKTIIRFGRGDDAEKLTDKGKLIISQRQIILVNKSMKKSFMQFMPENRIKVVENIAPKRFRKYSTSYRVKLRKKYQIKLSTTVVMYSGRLVESKNIGLLIEALKTVPVNTDLLGLFVGDDFGDRMKGYRGYTKELKLLSKRYPNRFMFLGKKKNSKMPQIYNLADIFCLPSKKGVEGLSNSLLEAQACGLKLLVSDVVENRIKGSILIDNLPLQLSEMANKGV